MCLPLGVALIIGGVSAGASAVATGYATSAANNAARYNAGVLEGNAQKASEEARRAESVGAQQESKYTQDVSRFAGRQRAVIAASGVDVDSGSAKDAQAETQRVAQEEVRVLREAVAFEAWGIRQQRQDIIQQAMGLRNTIRSPWASVGGSLLTSASSLAFSYASATANLPEGASLWS